VSKETKSRLFNTVIDLKNFMKILRCQLTTCDYLTITCPFMVRQYFRENEPPQGNKLNSVATIYNRFCYLQIYVIKLMLRMNKKSVIVLPF